MALCSFGEKRSSIKRVLYSEISLQVNAVNSIETFAGVSYRALIPNAMTASERHEGQQCVSCDHTVTDAMAVVRWMLGAISKSP
jgi:hypothetical protein